MDTLLSRCESAGFDLDWVRIALVRAHALCVTEHFNSSEGFPSLQFVQRKLPKAELGHILNLGHQFTPKRIGVQVVFFALVRLQATEATNYDDFLI